MANDTFLTDDYVAGVLAREAEASSIKYSSMGLQAFRSTKPKNLAKPNTRFLRHIIKETKNHNEALLAREAVEAQARLDDMTAVEKKRERQRPAADEMRRRQLGSISAILHGRKRGREADDSKSVESGEATDNERLTHSIHDGKRSQARDGGSRGEPAGGKGVADGSRHVDRSPRSKRDSHNHRRRERSRSPSHGERKRQRRSSCSDDNDETDRRSRTTRRRRSSRVDEGDHGARDLVGQHLSSRIRRGRLGRLDESEDTSDRTTDVLTTRGGRLAAVADTGDESDPLSDFIGPAPQPAPPSVRKRGRGTCSGASAMDKRFSATYDPALDAEPDLEGTEDWEDAVETFRDRQKWKQQGADRLRAAGFTAEQIKKWEKGGEEPEIDHVRWTKQGERREWDRGKMELPDGSTQLVPTWQVKDHFAGRG